MFIDTDTASDDAVALMIAFHAKAIEIVGVGVVAGNVPMEAGLQNALFTRDLCGSKAPVYRGAHKPLCRPLATGQHVHGKDGMGDQGLVTGRREPTPGHAAIALIEAARAAAGELVLVTLGPLTNIALALALEPELPRLIKRVVMMGGTGDGYGNVTPVAEFNFWVDPEAAEAVMGSGLKIDMVGWDMSREHAVFDEAEALEIRAVGTDRAIVAIDAQKSLTAFSLGKSGLAGFDLPDPLAMAIAIHPEFCTEWVHHPVHVVTGEGPTRGLAIVDDRRKLVERPAVAIARSVSRVDFIAALKAALR
jgi:purine nucleosidase